MIVCVGGVRVCVDVSAIPEGRIVGAVVTIVGGTASWYIFHLQAANLLAAAPLCLSERETQALFKLIMYVPSNP